MDKKINLKNWLVISIALVTVSSSSVWADGTYSGGNGSAGNPYQINDANDMNEIGTHTEDWDDCFLLTADINLAQFTGTQFNIIGNDVNDFTGVFDGSDHTISNFTYTTTGTNYIGLFGYVGSGGQIRDLGLVDPDVAAGSGWYTGGLVGWNNGTVSNCYATGTVTGDDYVGGLVGVNAGSVSNCYATGDVTGTGEWDVGGLVGANDEGSTVSNCYATGSVTGDFDVGGLVGHNNNGTVSNSYACGVVSGNTNVGGLAGFDSSGSYTSCFWNSDVSPTGIGNISDPPDVMGRTTNHMKQQATFTDYGWDFVSESTNGTDNYWRLCVDGIKYPELAWQSITGDLACPAGVDLVDFSFFAGRWLETGCDTSNDCGRADMDFSTDVGGGDLLLLTDNWLTGWRSISVQEYIDKMKGGWVGQMAGVAWGAPTEFQYQGWIMPENQVPVWQSGWINSAFGQDDLYVEMTFLRSLELYGMDVSIIQAGSDFADSGYDLWHANRAGRNNLRNGIAPPDSGHPQFNSHADDIDYQIEADYSGLIAPGLPNTVIGLGEKFGRLMNYGDGVYGGQFVGGMYAEAFFETDMETVVRAGLECIPVGSQYHECISDVLTWYEANPNWEDTWLLVENKYNDNPDYRRFSCTGPGSDFNIDAKINGAYIVMGLLYGNGDPNDTIKISMRCGQDSDCNPSNAAGVLFTSMGYSNVPSRFKSALNEGTYFSFTDYNFPLLMDVCESLARQAVVQAGGSITGEEIFVLPVSSPVPSALLQSWDPDPPINQILMSWKWRSFDVVMNPAGSPQATVTEGTDITAEIEFYESANNDGVNMGTLFNVYDAGEHTEGFNHAEHVWAFETGVNAYPYAAKSTVGRDSDFSEGNAPTPLGVLDLQLHPPDNDHLTVTAFVVPTSANYSVSNLAVRRVYSDGVTATLKMFNPSKTQIASLQATNNQDWVTDAGTYDLGSLTAGDNIYFAVDNDGDYGWDATEIAWTIEKDPVPPPVPEKWRSFDVVMNPTSPQATVTDGNDVTAEIEFYESANDNGVDMGSLFDVYDDGEHATAVNRAEYVWAFKTGWDAYPYAAKSTVGRGFDNGEGNTPLPWKGFDLQLHPPQNDHLTVAAFIVPEAGSYSVYDLAVRRVRSVSNLAGYRVFDSDKNLLTHITASTDQDWVTDPATYNLGALQAGDRIYFAADREDMYYNDATEIIWTIEKTGP